MKTHDAWYRWTIKQVEFGLVVRVKLVRGKYARIGDEAFDIHLLCKSMDDGEPLLGHLLVSTAPDHMRNLVQLSVKADESEWLYLLRCVTDDWPNGWFVEETAVCYLERPYHHPIRNLPISSWLALQHLSYTRGVICENYGCREKTDERAMLNMIEIRLNALITGQNQAFISFVSSE